MERSTSFVVAPGTKPEVHRKASLQEPGRIGIAEQPREQPFDHELELECVERDLPLLGMLAQVRSSEVLNAAADPNFLAISSPVSPPHLAVVSGLVQYPQESLCGVGPSWPFRRSSPLRRTEPPGSQRWQLPFAARSSGTPLAATSRRVCSGHGHAKPCTFLDGLR